VRDYARAAISGAVSDDKTPFLGFNEFYSLRVLARLNVAPVAKTRKSVDGRLLIVERFDLDEEGLPMRGLEDACGLLGLPPHEKYVPSMEEVLRATRAYLPSPTVRAQLEHLGWHLITNFVVRNADCHAKNIALYYTDRADVAYTPTYDIVTTQAYPRYAANAPGLSIEGRKTWAPGDSLERFFKKRLGIPSRDYALMVERLCESAVEVGREIIQAAKNDQRWRPVAKQMVHVWNEGMASLRSVKRDKKYKALSEDITAAGFSDPAAPEQPQSLGRSELLARPGSRNARTGRRPR
jgi:serine/threonine-protein kinase HipA